MSTPEPALPLSVILLTDFGTSDDFAGVCHGVILSRAPGAHVVHLTHGIDPQNVIQGARVLTATLPYMPVGVHVGVVDPGVGTDRRAIAVRTADGRRFVGPDNGLLMPAAAIAGGVVEAVSIEAEDILLRPLSATFHGRDVFAPAAAALATGLPLTALGPVVDPTTLVQLDLPVARFAGGVLETEVWQIDRFGNAALGVNEGQLHKLLDGAERVEVQIRNEHVFAHYAETFASVRSGELLIYVDAYGTASLAINRGDAAVSFRLHTGTTVSLRVR